VTALALASHGLFGRGGALALATHGVLPGAVAPLVLDLPPLPPDIVFQRPPPAVKSALEKYPNPRPVTPNVDGALELNQAPQCSLVEQMAREVDSLRQLYVDLGLRYYQVFSVVVRWSGGERRRGSPVVVGETPFLPVPKITGIENVARDLRAGGSVRRGDIRMTQISPRYTADDIDLLFPRALRSDEEAYIEVRGDARDGRTERTRYAVSGTPERGPWGWSVRLTKADEDRTREGRPL
jgi:hypothetical protein